MAVSYFAPHSRVSPLLHLYDDRPCSAVISKQLHIFVATKASTPQLNTSHLNDQRHYSTTTSKRLCISIATIQYIIKHGMVNMKEKKQRRPHSINMQLVRRVVITGITCSNGVNWNKMAASLSLFQMTAQIITKLVTEPPQLWFVPWSDAH